ncbi:serine hydrolase [Roseovarius nubinhibens]|uniref:serine hydrolase n=1 Tax=Roseovarius nubinhibens TaxID=314263 RepID=UPI0030EB70A4
MKTVIGAAAVLAPLAAVAEERVTAGDLAALAETHFAPVLAARAVPGAVVGITYRGEHHLFAHGLADRAGGVAVDGDTLFELGSISKLFTVTLAALAEERGFLSLDDRVAAHLPELEGTDFGALRLRDLGTHHTGGMPLQVPDEAGDVAGLIAWAKTWAPEQPGARSYSNISVGLLGHIVAQAMGQSYAEALEGDLLPAMGMGDTWVTVPQAAMPRYAFGYHRETDAPIRVNPGVFDAEAYGVKSSGAEMLHLLDLYLGQAEVGAEVGAEVKAALGATLESYGEPAPYVQHLIWESYPWPADEAQLQRGNSYDFILKPQPMARVEVPEPATGARMFNKTGATNGFGGYIVMLPEAELGVIYLGNRNIPNGERISATYGLIVDILAQK